MLHLPILRGGVGGGGVGGGEPYRSLNTEILPHVVTGEPVAEISQANPGLIARDLAKSAHRRRVLEQLSGAELVAICGRAAKLFVEGDLPCGIDGEMQSPEHYVRQLSSTTGMPEAMCRGNMAKLEFVFAEMERVLAGLSRGLDSAALDRGFIEEDGRTVSYLAQADSLGVILPSNSPGVHSLWLPSIALKTPVTLKPGSREPWTPLRACQALITAGSPPEAVAFYPTSHSGGAEILLGCGRSMLFGDQHTVRPWRNDPRVQLHGPGWSKVLLAADQLAEGDQEAILEVVAESVAANGGRSCVNASGVWVDGKGHPGKAREFAEALAARLARVEARPLDHPEAALAGFGDPRVARRMSQMVDQHLAAGGAEDLTAQHRPDGERLVEVEGLTYLLPTVVWCDDRSHPLAQTELLFPFVSVVEVDLQADLDDLPPSLVVSGLTDDPDLRRRLLGNRSVERLNLGPIPTSRVSWDQPHEGNLFEHLYRQRSFQATG